jgi:hypothetical protein
MPGEGGRMKYQRFTILLVAACMLVLFAGEAAFGATKIVKLTVPGCQ